jgi:hypothetical protein
VFQRLGRNMERCFLHIGLTRTPNDAPPAASD